MTTPNLQAGPLSPPVASPAADPARPIRVVVFTGGPSLAVDVQTFVCRLEEHPLIELVGVLSQSAERGARAIVADLWRRRGLLTLPLLGERWLSAFSRFVAHPWATLRRRRVVRGLMRRVRFVPDIHAPAVVASVGEMGAELGLIYGGPILKSCLFDVPPLGTLGIHHGIAPEYRGKKTTFWAVYNGEHFAGVTIQKINERLDGGDVVDIGRVPVGRKTLGAVSRRVEELGFQIYVEAILRVRDGEAQPVPQPRQGTLYRDPKLRDIVTLRLRYLSRAFTRTTKKATAPLIGTRAPRP